METFISFSFNGCIASVRSENVVRKGGIFGFSEEITVFLIFLTQVDYNKI